MTRRGRVNLSPVGRQNNHKENYILKCLLGTLKINSRQINTAQTADFILRGVLSKQARNNQTKEQYHE